MPFVRKEETEEQLRDALLLVEQGALHQAVGLLLSVARRVAKANEPQEAERTAAAIGELLARPDLSGMTASEDTDLTRALAELRSSLS